jgi:hypothetical protein
MKAIRLIAGLAALALLVAGCGGGSKSPSAAGSEGGGSSESASPASQGVAYGACMREHGVPDFPDPKVSTNGSEVRVAVGVTPAITGNPHFKSAQQACRKLLPGGGPGSSSGPRLSTAEQAQVLQFVACVRKHGEPSLPDPTFSGGGVHLPGSVDTHTSAFKSAELACKSLIPTSLRGGGSGGS